MPSKLIARRRLLARREKWRRAGKRVVFTNGVFDILHAGHVSLLETARGLGDVLVVGLNSDSSARGLGKGPGRPLNRFPDRAAVLSALACVDAVTGFPEDTPARLLAALRPDILVKGADYGPDQVAGRESCGKLVLLRLKKGYSTTALVRRIRSA